ncbi:unnamed protein product [Haemonchus placei]|uniref:Fibronectin type-III domain-containing protein n=1 Tax=Haemonchus placei TaxID=6290 RepID=A0A0N4WJK6_HAEPC|nr:unnamed protein product [Haemonchus placei]
MLRPYALLLLLPAATLGFIVLPYIQIDYAHYFRLAQCQAKCTEKVSGAGVSCNSFLLARNGLWRRPSGPTRYVIRWRQRSQLLGNRDEAQWITASVEPGTFFKVRGLIPGVQYSFMVTAVGPSGRLGNTITSPWTEILSSATVKAPTPPLTLKNGYNTDRGVIAQLEWPRTPQDSCYYKLQLSNSSSQTNRDVELDASFSILLPHLEFDSDYTVSLAAVSADKLQTSKSITAHFKSLPCKDIHGRGSLQCVPLAPEPVSDLAITVRPNGTGLITWTPSADSQNILFYQVVYHALEHGIGCRVRKETVNVKAIVNFAEVTFPGQQCEYVVRVINYDLIGRDASTEARIRVEPSPPLHVKFIVRPEVVTIAACLVFLPFALLLLFCRHRRCPHRVMEKHPKLTEYV